MEQEHATPSHDSTTAQPISPSQPTVVPPVEPSPKAEVPKHNSHKPSIAGIIFAALSLGLSAFGNLLVHAHATPRTTTTIDQKVGQAVDNGVSHVLGALFGVPFLVGGITFALVSAVLLAIRMRKIRSTGWIITLLAVLVIIWSFSIAIGGFDYIRAKPAH